MNFWDRFPRPTVTSILTDGIIRAPSDKLATMTFLPVAFAKIKIIPNTKSNMLGGGGGIVIKLFNPKREGGSEITSKRQEYSHFTRHHQILTDLKVK